MQKVVLNSNIKLKVLFSNFKGESITPASIVLNIIKPDLTIETINVGFVEVEKGYYYFDYLNTNLEGIYTQEWIAEIDGEEVQFDDKFEVFSGGIIKTSYSTLDYNKLIFIEISDTIKAADGTSFSEEENLEYYFCTELNPFYAPIELLRVECGTWMNDIPDDTLALAIHWSSIKADELTCKKPVGEHYYYARTRFVLFDAAISLFTMPVGAYGSNSKTHKTLGDLSVQNADLDLDIKDLLKEYKEQRDEWMRIVNAGGHITFGQSLGPTFAEKRVRNKNYVGISRQWHDPWGEYYWQPTVNSKYKKPGEDKYKSGFTIWNHFYYTTARLGRGQ